MKMHMSTYFYVCTMCNFFTCVYMYICMYKDAEQNQINLKNIRNMYIHIDAHKC